jgi:hypothetical protein
MSSVVVLMKIAICLCICSLALLIARQIGAPMHFYTPVPLRLAARNGLHWMV